MAVLSVPTSLHCSSCQEGTTVTQECAACCEALCPSCYGPWLELACSSCRATAARRRRLGVAA